MVQLRLEQTFEVHQKYIRYILSAGGRDGRFFYRLSCPPFLNRQEEILYLGPERLVSESGTKATPLLGSENRGCVILSVSYRNVSAALSLLNKVCNSIYTRNVPAESTSPEPERFFGRRESSVPNSPSPTPNT
jgi:hypothetical protein